MDIDARSRGLNMAGYDNANFRKVLEDHMTYLRNDPDTKRQDIPPGYAYRFEGNFYGLLTAYNVEFQLHWVVLRMNDMTHESQATRDLRFFIHPDPQKVAAILQVFSTVTSSG